jgi:Ni2+-binding GTPase involved in maturation of urease and hydrogenase
MIWANLRLVLLCVTQGEDKPLKYPTIIKMDVAAARRVLTKAQRAPAYRRAQGHAGVYRFVQERTEKEEFFDFLVHRSATLRTAGLIKRFYKERPWAVSFRLSR